MWGGQRGRTDIGSRVTGETGERLKRLSRQWSPVPAEASPEPEGASPAPTSPWQRVLDDAGPAGPLRDDEARRPDRPPRLVVGPWNRSAVRGLVVITCAALAVAGWWWWSGRPRAIAVAPTVLATGAPITMLPLVSAPSAPVPASSADSMSADPIAADPMSVDPIDTGGLSPTTPVADPSALLVPASSGAPSSGPPVVVHVIGFIRRPGLVTLPAGSRVADAVEAAGGVTRRRAADSVNLARVLVDGEQIVIAGSAAQGATRARSSPTVPAGPVTRPGTTGATPAAAMDLNAVDAATLELLPGVGPVLADRIVMWRTANGPFRSIEELGEVSGIGDSIMAQLRPLVRV